MADLATVLRQKRRALARLVTAAENASIAEAREDAVKLSSGPYSLAALARAGHPYALRHKGRGASAGYDPSIINAQSGRFRRAWRIIKCGRQWNQLKTTLWNDAPEAQYMFGTTVMRPRRIDQRVARDIQRSRLLRLRQSLIAGLRA